MHPLWGYTRLARGFQPRHLRIPFVIVLILAATGAAAARQLPGPESQATGTISGVVTNERGEPMKDVQVDTWLRTNGGVLKQLRGAITDAAGSYRITAVPSGDHIVVAHIWHKTTRQGPATADSCVPLAPPPMPGPSPRARVAEEAKHPQGEWFITLPCWIPERAPDDRRTAANERHDDVSRDGVVAGVRGQHCGWRRPRWHRPATASCACDNGPRIESCRRGKRIGKGTEVRLLWPGAPSDVSEDVLTELPLEVPPAGLDDVVVSMASGVTMCGRLRFDARRRDRN